MLGGGAAIDSSIIVIVDVFQTNKEFLFAASGASTTLTVPTGYDSYSWSTGATTSAITVTPTANTTYTITGTISTTTYSSFAIIAISATDYMSTIITWLDADRGVTVATGVSTWADQYNSCDMTQGTASYQPTLVESSLNGHSIIRFDGVDNILNSPALIDSACPFTIFVVHKITATEDGAVFDSENGNTYNFGFSNNGTKSYFYNGYPGGTLSYTQATPYSAFITQNIIYNGANTYIYENGTEKTIGTTGCVNLTNFEFGKRADNSSYLPMDMAQFVIFNSAITDATDRASFNNYLKYKYNHY